MVLIGSLTELRHFIGAKFKNFIMFPYIYVSVECTFKNDKVYIQLFFSLYSIENEEECIAVILKKYMHANNESTS